MADETGRSYDPAKDASAQEPLTANEQKLVTRLFGDPFAFPMEFKAWLRGWLEEQFPRIGSLSVGAETGAAGAFVPPAGSILDYGGDTAPGGYLMCNGAEYDKTSLVYQRLFNAIGYKYGTGSTGNMFKVPDFQGRIAVGRGTHADVDTMGDSENQPVHIRSVKHGHSISVTLGDSGHSHAPDWGQTDFWGGDPSGGEGFFAAGPDYKSLNAERTSHEASGVYVSGATVGPGGAPLDSPAYLVVNKIISLGA